MNRLSLQDRARIIGCLVEGMSMRATTRLVDCSINTVTKLLVDLGTACAIYQNEVMRNLPCRRIQVDEIWAFCHTKKKNLAPEMRGVLGRGDVWTWVAIDADTKLVPSYLVGGRDGEYACAFIDDLADPSPHYENVLYKSTASNPLNALKIRRGLIASYRFDSGPGHQ